MGIMGLWTCLVGNRGMIHSMTIEKHPSKPHSLRSAPVSGRNYQDVWFQTWGIQPFSNSRDSKMMESITSLWGIFFLPPCLNLSINSSLGIWGWEIRKWIGLMGCKGFIGLGRLDPRRDLQLGPLGGLPIDFYTIEMQDVDSGDPSPDPGRMLMAYLGPCREKRQSANHTWKWTVDATTSFVDDFPIQT